MPKSLSIFIARFPYLGAEHPDVCSWLVSNVLKMKRDLRIKDVLEKPFDDTPIYMTRNLSVEVAKAHKADILLMIDSDMKPDAYLPSNPNRLGAHADAVPFWDSSLDFMLDRWDQGPCVVAAPYCGKPPHENPFAFRFATYQSDHPNVDIRIEQFTREEAAIRSGFEECACLPTGLILIDMRVFDNPLVTPPYFDYEWSDKYKQKKASTEDCVFTRDLCIANIPQFINWDAWAGHWKAKCVGKPVLLCREQVHAKYIEAALSNRSAYEKLRFTTGPRRDDECNPAPTDLKLYQPPAFPCISAATTAGVILTSPSPESKSSPSPSPVSGVPYAVQLPTPRPLLYGSTTGSTLPMPPMVLASSAARELPLPPY